MFKTIKKSHRDWWRIVEKYFNDDNSKLFNWKTKLLFGTVFVYPVTKLLVDGPLGRFIFPWKFATGDSIPDKIEDMIEKEYTRIVTDLTSSPDIRRVQFHISNEFHSFGSGSASVLTGAQIALPFYVLFDSVQQARRCCQERFADTLSVLDGGKNFQVDWDSDFGEALLRTMVISDNAKRFLIHRCIRERLTYAAYGEQPTTWFSYFTGSGVGLFVVDRVWPYTRRFRFMFPLFYLSASLVSYCLYRVNISGFLSLLEMKADKDTYKKTGHSNYWSGGREYYRQMLRRNRLIRARLGMDGLRLLSATGDIKKKRPTFSVLYSVANECKQMADEIDDHMDT